MREVRRYPVKAMGGESLARVAVDARGLVGDRGYAVVDADGRFAAAKDSRRFRRRDAVLAYGAGTRPDGTVYVARQDREWVVGSPPLDEELSTRCGEAVRVLPEQGVCHFDAGSLSLVGSATLDWCARELGVDADHRRLRANLLVETAEPFEEESWVGREILIGDASPSGAGVVLHVVERVERCRTIDLAQDGVTTTTPWLKALTATRELCVAVYADVRRPGTVAVGDVVRPD